MTINQFHDSIRSLANVGQSQYFPPEEIDLQLNNATKTLFTQEYRHFEATQEISDTLGFYKVKTEPIEVDEDGIIALPADFFHLTGIDAVMSDDSQVEMEVLSDSHWPKRKYSKDFAPTAAYPIARQIGAADIEALPLAVAAVGETPAIIGVIKVVVYYLRRPADAIYGYTVNPSGTGWTFQAATSVEVDWPEVGHARIQDKALGLIGLILRDNMLVSNESVKKGQNEDQ